MRPWQLNSNFFEPFSSSSSSEAYKATSDKLTQQQHERNKKSSSRIKRKVCLSLILKETLTTKFKMSQLPSHSTHSTTTLRQTTGADERTYVDGNSLLRQISSQTYTLENLFNDCEQRGLQLLQDHANGRDSALTTTLDTVSFNEGQRLGKRSTYAAAFQSLTIELEEAASTLVPVAVSGLGIFGYRLFNLGISIPFFDVNPKFANTFRLSRSSAWRSFFLFFFIILSHLSLLNSVCTTDCGWFFFMYVHVH